MARKKSSRAWVQQHLHDPYVRRAQQQGYRARAAFKLSEVLDAWRLLSRGDVVVDLGAAPGSWSQVVRERLLDAQGKLQGRIIALDRLPMDPIEGVEFIEGDFREQDVLEQLEAALDGRRVDLVISDMAPNLSGVKAADAAAIQHVHELALAFALDHLRNGGALVLKAFHGSGFSQTVEQLRRHFRRVHVLKPDASRDKSAETYLIARDLQRRRP